MSGTRRFTAAEYYTLYNSDHLVDGDRVELIEGYVIGKPARSLLHEMTYRRMSHRLPRCLPVGWFLQIGGAISLPADNEPEPDGVVLRGDETSYDTRHPGPADIGLAIEVSDSSRGFDRRVKGRVYARAGIPVYWLLNVAEQMVEVYTDPDPAADPPAYRTRTDFAPGQDVPLVLDDVEAARVPVADLIP